MKKNYSTYEECVELFYKLQKKLPDHFYVETIGKSWEERGIIAVTVTNNVQEAHLKPALLFTGTIHAREWIGIELAIAFAQYIEAHHDCDHKLLSIFERVTLYMVPCVNPDGFMYSKEHFCFWRKNRRKNGDGTYGVDLNRNFSVGWKHNPNTNTEVYAGPSAFSEPETQAMRDFVDTHNNIAISLDYHSQGNVYFPAHNFRHEDAVDATDLNVLVATMAEESRRVSEIEYGIHMGKRPLLKYASGSGRQYYYSLGILSTVVEVGTRNINDYEEDMMLSIKEQMSALLHALNEVPNYSKENPLPRVEHIRCSEYGASSAVLEWEYDNDEVFFELYRSDKHKGFCNRENRVAITKERKFVDSPLKSATSYWYYIRAVNTQTGVKSPFAPMLGIRTNPEYDSFIRTLLPQKNEVGYISEKKGKTVVTENPMLVGVSNTKGVCYGVCEFSTASIPEDAIITDAWIAFYPSNRVHVNVERHGEWRVAMLNQKELSVDSKYKELVSEESVLCYIDGPLHSHQLAQGVWRTFVFGEYERSKLQKALKQGKALFRMEGPKDLPLDRKSQLMEWEVGFGSKSNGLNYRPYMHLSYTLKRHDMALYSYTEFTYCDGEKLNDTLEVGLDHKGAVNIGVVTFNVTDLPSAENTVITSAYIELTASSVQSALNAGLRIHVEMIDDVSGERLKTISHKRVFKRIGYDTSAEAFAKSASQRFVFDSTAIRGLLSSIDKEKRISFAIFATVEKEFKKDQLIDFIDKKREHRPVLEIDFIKRQKEFTKQVENLQFHVEEGVVKLTWTNPEDSAFKGVFVVKNPFRVPGNIRDGQKLYAGKDSYTRDAFGALDIEKYYAVFAYDDVPNYSEPVWIKYDKS